MKKPFLCRPGYKRCGERCFPKSVTCADEREAKTFRGDKRPNKGITPMNLALIGGSVVFASGLAFYAFKLNGKTYRKPFKPELAKVEKTAAVPTTPTIPLHKQIAIPADEIEKWDNERALTPEERRNKAISWAQEKVRNADKTFVVDLETADLFEGVNPLTDDASVKLSGAKPPGIVQIAIHRLDGGESYNIVLDPEQKINPVAGRVHGFTDEKVKGQPTFKDVYPFLAEKFDGMDVTAFNSRYDLQLFDAMCDAHNLPRFNYNRDLDNGLTGNNTDIMHNFALYQGRIPNKEADLAYAQLPTRQGIRAGEAHDALEDAFAASEVIFRMAQGDETLIDRKSPSWQLETDSGESQPSEYTQSEKERMARTRQSAGWNDSETQRRNSQWWNAE